VVRPSLGASLLSACALALCVGAGPAAAASIPATKAVEVQGRSVELDQHADDPRFGLTPEQIRTTFGPAPSSDGPLADAARAAAKTARRAPGVATASAAVAPDATGCATERTVDDTDDQRTTLPRYKAIYAYPRDQANRYATYRNLIQRSAGWVTDKIAESGGRGPRWDYGTSCGAGSLDILTVELPRDASAYLASQGGRIDQLTTDLDALRAGWDLAPGTWNFVVWADWLGHSGWATAQGQHYLDDRATPNNYNNRGDLYALLYGAGSNDFLGSGSLGYAAYAVTHEVGHTLGSVSDNAPHSTLAGHCTDGYSIMCYNDGGAQASLYTATACPTGGGPAGYDGVVFDCGGDDYLSPSPDPSGWLFGHWNVFNSVFMCEAATCLGDANTVPDAALTATPDTAPTGTEVTLDAGASSDADAGDVLSYDLDPGDGRGDVVQGAAGATTAVTYDRPGTYTARVEVHDGHGGTAVATTTVTVTNRLPTAALELTPNPVAAGQAVAVTATASDPEGTALVVAFDLDGDGVFETGTGSGLTTTLTAPAQSVPVSVQVTDADGGSSTATAVLDVTTPLPGDTPSGGGSPPPEPTVTAPTPEVPAPGGPEPPPADPGTPPAPPAAPPVTPPAAPGPAGPAKTTPAATAGRPAVLLTRLRAGRLTVKLRCAGAAPCRVRTAFTAGGHRGTRTITVRAGTTRQLIFRAGGARRARITVSNLVTNRALLSRTITAR
jgi:hypothetical protein